MCVEESIDTVRENIITLIVLQLRATVVMASSDLPLFWKNDIYTLMGKIIHLDYSKNIISYRWDKLHNYILNVIN